MCRDLWGVFYTVETYLGTHDDIYCTANSCGLPKSMPSTLMRRPSVLHSMMHSLHYVIDPFTMLGKTIFLNIITLHTSLSELPAWPMKSRLLQRLLRTSQLWHLSGQQTMRINPVMNFVFPNHLYDFSAPREYIHHVYEQAFRRGTSHFAKATCKETGEMVGYVSFRVEDGKGDGEQNSKTLHPLPKDADLELYHMYFGGRARKEKEHMAGLKYACEFMSTPSTKHAPIEV